MLIGEKRGVFEEGHFYRISGEHIDNDDARVPYSIMWKDYTRFIGVIDFRGHDRKFCGADTEEHLSCH